MVKTTGDGMLAVFDDPAAGDLGGDRRASGRCATRPGARRVRSASGWRSTRAQRRPATATTSARRSTGSPRILAIGHGGQILASAVAAGPRSGRAPRGSRAASTSARTACGTSTGPSRSTRSSSPISARRSRRSARSARGGRTSRSQLTSFVGRERELAEVETLVDRHRLVTLIGTGGTGKTRLMLEAAGAPRGSFSRTGSGLPSSPRSAIPRRSPRRSPGRSARRRCRACPRSTTVTAFLADKELLLLLDNAEHLVDGVAGVAERLLGAAPRLRILTTSREALAIAGRGGPAAPVAVVPVDRGWPGRAGEPRHPVELEAAASTEAVRLFTERATAVDPGFALGGSERRAPWPRSAVASTGSRSRSSSPPPASRRCPPRTSRCASATGSDSWPAGAAPRCPRQQTLHALIDWSWDLLTDEDKRLLRRLSIFSGGWTADCAQPGSWATGDVPLDRVDLIDDLTRLVDRSLVIVDRGPTTRYRMLETIRQYAREKLIEAAEVEPLADRHFAAYADLAAAGRAQPPGPGHGGLARPVGRRRGEPRRGARVGPRGSPLGGGPNERRAPRLLGGPGCVPPMSRRGRWLRSRSPAPGRWA